VDQLTIPPRNSSRADHRLLEHPRAPLLSRKRALLQVVDLLIIAKVAKAASVARRRLVLPLTVLFGDSLSKTCNPQNRECSRPRKIDLRLGR